jgi:putative AlgH/UPF0301 family transcriptional regulator
MLLFALAQLQQIGATKQLAVGQILVATEKSHDPDLSRSVIVLVDSGPAVATGLMLNRPHAKLAYFGGPVALGTRWLFRSSTQPADAKHILGGVYMVSKESAVPKNVIVRVYAGCVGWSAQQLAYEVSRGLWKVLPGDAAVIFDPHPETLWPRMTHRN